MKPVDYLLPCLALGAAAVLLAPAQESMGYTTIGGRLSAETQRDFRVFNNFEDVEANDNLTPDPQFPGFVGPEMAIWKGGVEWGSLAHGDGSGDPTQPTLGDGGANFDFFWCGAADSIGGVNSNVVSSIPSFGPGTLAYAETPIEDGWRIRFNDHYRWHDGPDDNPTGFDIQGLACHELGHALGLGHTSDATSTMYYATAGTTSSNLRSINNDDVAGVQFIYGAMSPIKPVISSVSVQGSTVTITGTNLPASHGEVWFTNADFTDPESDARVRVTGVCASAGGTQIVVTAPAGAGNGDVAVKLGSESHASLSNTYPIDLGGGGPGDPLAITSVVPSTIENLVPGTAETIAVHGCSFNPWVVITIDGAPLYGGHTLVSSTLMTFKWESLSALGLHTLRIDNGIEFDTATIQVIANPTPTLQVGNGDPGNTVGSWIPVRFGGQPGDVHFLLASTSALPSVLPGMLALDMGNDFQELYQVGAYTIGGAGTVTTLLITSGLSDQTLYWQSLDIKIPIATSWPMVSSNLQSTYTP